MRQAVHASFQPRGFTHHRVNSWTKVHHRCEHCFVIESHSQEKTVLFVEAQQNPLPAHGIVRATGLHEPSLLPQVSSQPGNAAASQMSEFVNLDLREGAEASHERLNYVQVAFALGLAMLQSIHWAPRSCICHLK